MKFSTLTTMAVLGWCGFSVSFVSAAEDALVTLPAFEVKGLRPWLYAEIPGYQILSLANEKDTKAILARLQNASRFTPLFFPKGYNLQFTGRSTLFLHHFADKQTVDDATQRLQLSFTPKAFTVSAGDTFVEFPTPERIADWLKGRQTPSEATVPRGRWRPLPKLSDYNANVPAYDAFPSGHLASTMATLTVVALNYPEHRFIWPVSSAAMGVLSFTMVNNGVHWASDYPLALAIGGVIGNVVVSRGRTLVRMPPPSPAPVVPASRAASRLEIRPMIAPGIVGVRVAW